MSFEILKGTKNPKQFTIGDGIQLPEYATSFNKYIIFDSENEESTTFEERINAVR